MGPWEGLCVLVAETRRLDILSIPQSNREVQQLAVDSLYVYASAVTALIIIAPDSVHEQTKEKAGLESYKSRVWTRVEQVSHCSAHGIASMFVEVRLVGGAGGLQQVTREWIGTVVCIFEAGLTCCRLKHRTQDKCDRESLVLPLLGLWYQVLSDHRMGKTGTASLHAIIEAKKDRVFPASYKFEKVLDDNVTSQTEEVELFGDMIARIERW